MMATTTITQSAAPLRQQVVERLRQEILDDVLHPGQRLLENTLCENYGVSRTVVREALRQLESEHLITMLPNRGPIVTVLTENNIRDLYEMRGTMEGLAGQLFAERASTEQVAALVAHIAEMETTYLRGTEASRGEAKDRFYTLLLDGAGNEVLTSSLRGIHSRIGIFRHFAFVDEERVRISMEELRKIVRAAAVDRDPARAKTACQEHILLAGELAIIEYGQHIVAEND
jgi:DNA-binding GntR family transcriptional regulator